MASKDTLISAQDFITLKNSVKTELTRRSNSKSVGSMSKYIGTDYEYSVNPAKSKKILSEHIVKITTPLDAINKGSLTPNSDSLVIASTIESAASLVNNLSSIKDTSSSSGCKNSCSGLCSTGCYSSCSGCTGNCKGGCNTTCSSSCANDCDSSCYTGCQESCSGNCQSTCSGCTSCSGCGSFL